MWGIPVCIFLGRRGECCFGERLNLHTMRLWNRAAECCDCLGPAFDCQNLPGSCDPDGRGGVPACLCLSSTHRKMAKQDCPGARPLAAGGEEGQQRVGLSQMALNFCKISQVQKANVILV